MRLVRGRLPPETGGEVMINEALAKKYFGEEDPIGHSLHNKADGGSKEGDWPIVGIVNYVCYTVSGKRYASQNTKAEPEIFTGGNRGNGVVPGACSVLSVASCKVSGPTV